jgi:hypothetical protein
MHAEPVALLTLCLSALLSSGYSNEGTSPMAAKTEPSPTMTTADKATTATPVSRKRASACELVAPAEMSTILGGAVLAAAGGNDRPPSSTECIYSSAAGPAPYAELEVDWGGGDTQALGSAAGLVNGTGPPGAVDPLHGLGERAYQVTAEQVFISTQGNLMMIRFLPQTGDVVPKARRIYETASARM